MILNYPSLPSLYFENKIKKLENNKNSHYNNRKLIKNKIEYAYGIILESSDRIIDEDYELVINNYKKAYSIFLEAKQLCIDNLIGSNNQFDNWFNNKKKITFGNDDIYELYYLSAAIGGAIKSSRGNPEELIYLPKIGKLLKKAIQINPKWNRGALQSAMMIYTASRLDLPSQLMRDSINYYFSNTVNYADSLDASVFVSYAEIIHKSDQNKKKFINTLDYVLSMKNTKDPLFRLSNMIAKKRAKWLLINLDDYFF